MEFRLTEQQMKRLTKSDLIQFYTAALDDNDELKKKIDSQTDMIKELNNKIELLLEKLNLSQAQRFGRSTEKDLLGNEAYDQLKLLDLYASCFNEAEAATDAGTPEEPDMDTVIVTSHKRKKQKGKREEDLKDLPHEVISIELSEEELAKELGDGYRRLDDEVYKRLEFVPASFNVKEYHVAVYVSRDGKKFLKGQRPQKDLFRNSIATPSLLSAILNHKYVNAMPIHRLSQEFARNDLKLSTQVMCGWVIKGCEIYLSIIYDALKDTLLKQLVIQADETVLKVTRDGRAAGCNSYMWVYLTGELNITGQNVILFDYQKTRATEHPRAFLNGYSGAIVSDGYISYHQLSTENSLTAAGCWAHCRRRFANAIKAAKKNLTDEQIQKSIAGQAYTRIGIFYQLEASWKDYSIEKRLEHRQKYLSPLVDEYFTWIKEHHEAGTVLPNSETGEGITYSINQEKYLRAFLDNGEIPIDNSAAERAVRPFTIGRKNWNIIDTVSGAKASAIAYSIAETAKANNLKPYYYFRHLLTELPKRIDNKKDANFSVEDLLPWSPSLPEECKKNI